MAPRNTRYYAHRIGRKVSPRSAISGPSRRERQHQRVLPGVKITVNRSRRQTRRQIRARFSEGVLRPLEGLNLREGTEVLITVAVRPEILEERRARSRAAIGAWKGSIDGEKLKQTLYEARVSGSRSQQEL